MSERNTNPDAAERISELRAQVAYHNQRYHELDTPEISDGDFDALARELRQLEAENPDLAVDESPVNAVGGAPSVAVRARRPRRPDDQPRQRDVG